jgi:hypothetical protein
VQGFRSDIGNFRRIPLCLVRGLTSAPFDIESRRLPGWEPDPRDGDRQLLERGTGREGCL